MTLAHTTDPIVGATRALSGAATTKGPSINLNNAVDWVAIQLNVSATGGTSPALTASVEWSVDGQNWATADTADSFTAVSATGVVVKRFTVKAPWCRISEVLAGTSPTLTYTPTYYSR